MFFFWSVAKGARSLVLKMGNHQSKALDIKTRVNNCDADVYSEEDESAVRDSQYIVNQLPIINSSVKLGRYPWKIPLKTLSLKIP